jgi:hypothetical protein
MMGSPPNLYYSNWDLNDRISHGGLNSDSCQVLLGQTQFLTTKAFNIDLAEKAYLSFWHICKINPYDIAQVLISLDSGWSWQTIPGSSYLGASNYSTANGLKFSETSYGVTWYPGVASQVPHNTWWKKEVFDLSFACGYTDVVIRFKLEDGGAPGPDGRLGWFIDDLSVFHDLAANSPEIINAPQISVYPNPTNNYIYFTECVDDVLLFNIYGQMLYSYRYVQEIDMTPFPEGVFFAKIGDKTIKIVKQ